MKKLFVLVFILNTVFVSAQSHQAFQGGEWFKFRVHYGVFNASFATMEVKETTFNNKPVFHIVGQGKSTGLLHLFFKVDDNYESYVDKEKIIPYRFIRQIDEGGHTRDEVTDFDHESKTAFYFNRKHNVKDTYPIKENVHDMLSAFYYMRNHLDTNGLRVGDMMNMHMFIDKESKGFQLKFLGREVINTKLGKIATLKFRPYVLAGRVFKEKESLTIWVSDDDNRMPVKIKANLAVGSLDADIDAFKGLKHPLNIIMK